MSTGLGRPSSSRQPTQRQATATEPTRRLRLAQALGLVALVAGLVGALGPADRVRTTYSWPPPNPPAAGSGRISYTPLLLVRHEPELISADMRCALPGRGPRRALSTARYPERTHALTITQSSRELVVRVGREELSRVAIPAEGRVEDCAHRIAIAGGRWTLSGGAGIERRGTIAQMPVVYGLFSDLDLRAGDPLRVSVTTIPHATKPTSRQVVAWALAALTAVGSLILVALDGWPHVARRRMSVSFRRAAASLHPADGVIALALFGWALIAPVNFDDGWVIQREQMFDVSGGFSNYYNVLATNLPLDYWLEWLHRWLAEASNTLIVYRLVVVPILLAAWAVCRWVVIRVLPSDDGDHHAVWLLTVAFVAGSFAWGMTLRPEPVTALLATGVTACMVRFRLRNDVGSVAVGAVLTVLALTAHPAGIVALAPVVVSMPQLVLWARSRLASAVTIVSAATALLATLAFVGADLEQRLADAEKTQELFAVGRDETERYALLSQEPFGTPLRRAYVALLLLAVVAFVLRRRGRGRGLIDLPGAVLAVGLLLLAATPSKWPSHFGALIGIGALAITAETVRLRQRGEQSARWEVVPLVAVGTATLAIVWSWSERHSWNALDLRTLDWEPELLARFGVPELLVLLPVLMLAAALVIARLTQRGGAQTHRVPWSVTSWLLVAVAIPAIVFTAGVLVVDAVRTSSWTLTRHNLRGIVGNERCGLGNDVLVSLPGSSGPVRAARRVQVPPPPAWMPAAPVAGLPRFALGPTIAPRTQTPWFDYPARGRTGLFLAGTLGADDSLALEWAGGNAPGATVIRTDEISHVVNEGSSHTRWRFYSAGELPELPTGATRFRVAYRPATTPANALAVTAPVTYVNERLASLMKESGTGTLVYPELYLYFPCRQMPALRDGAVEVPRYIVISQGDAPPLRYHVTSPFVGLLDLYEVRRLPVADSAGRVTRLQVFEVDTEIARAALVPPLKSRIVT